MTRKEMIPASALKFTCKPEWDLLCWTRRELGLLKVKDTKAKMLTTITQILLTMDDTFSDWPEDPK